GQALAGGQAEYVRVPFAHANLHPVTDAIADEQAIFVGDILATAFAAVRNAALQPGDSVGVLGCGPVGLLVIECARLVGAAKVFAIDRIDERLEHALRLGALPIDSKTNDPVEAIRTATGGRGPDAVIDCA